MDLPADDRLWQHEMFAPTVTIHGVDSSEEAARFSSDVTLGLTAEIYSEDPAAVDWFLDNIEACVFYGNRETGA